MPQVYDKVSVYSPRSYL